MEENYATKLLKQIAFEMKKPFEKFQPFAQILEDNFFDSEESLKLIDESQLISLKIPAGIAKMMIDKLKLSSKEEPYQTQFTEQEIKDLLIQLKREAITIDNFMESVRILDKILFNILQDPSNSKLRTLRVTNQQINEKIWKRQSTVELLKLVDFVYDGQEFLTLEDSQVNVQAIKILELLIKENSEQLIKKTEWFNPYQSSISSSNQISVSSMAQKSNFNPDEVTMQLNRLQQERDNLIKPIQDRQITAYLVNQNIQISYLNYLEIFIIDQLFQQQDQDEFQQEETAVNPQLKKALVEAIKFSQENVQFSMKRKQQLNQLIKLPLYLTTTIRIKFPDQEIFEAVFTPKENIAELLKILTQYLDDPLEKFYLFRTPPVEKLNMHQTFESLESVPSGLFYFSYENQESNKRINFLKKELLLKAKDL